MTCGDRVATWMQYLPLVAVIPLGLWLLASPYVLGYEGVARTNHLIAGPLVASVGTIALGGATRGMRWVNVIIGVWLVTSAALLAHAEPAFWSAIVAGALVTVLSLFPGPPLPALGGGWRSLIDTKLLSERR